MVTLSWLEVTRVVLVMLTIGLLCGIPLGTWLAHLHVDDRRLPPLVDPQALAAHLEAAAELLRTPQERTRR
jgi:hypothetical protein